MDYRVYFLGDDGHVVARFAATQLQNGHPIEVWQLDRKVALIEPPK